MSKADNTTTAPRPAGIKSGGEVSDEQEATENQNPAEEAGGTSTSAKQESANEQYHQESHKSTEQDSEKPSGDYDSACGWKEVYAEQGCKPGSWRP